MPSNESSTNPLFGKDFFSDALQKLGVAAVLAVLLMLYYQAESRRWDERAKVDEARWQQLFQQSQERNSEALQAIEACCHDRLQRLENLEVERRTLRGTR